MNELIKKFDGYKFRQAMKENPYRADYFGDDYELAKEQRLILASQDVARMWLHIYNKLSEKRRKK